MIGALSSVESHTMSSEQAQANFQRVLDDVRIHKKPYLLTQAGEPQVLIISVEEYEDLLEELALLSDPEHIAQVAEARADYRAGAGRSFDDYVTHRKARGD